MKSISIKALAAACGVLMALSAAGCGASDNKDKTAAETTAAETTAAETTAAETTAAETTAAETTEATAAEQEQTVPANAAADAEIIGTWEYESGGFTYTFNDDGSGTYDVLGEVMPFTYEADGKLLSIRYKDVDATLDLEYTLQGDTLTIKDSTGSDTIYKKQAKQPNG